MRMLPSILAVSCLAFVSLGTTYVIKEGGVEVGRWEEADGKDEIKVVENDSAKPAVTAAVPAAPAPKQAGEEQLREEAEAEAKRWAAIREERTTIGFRKGMTREEVEAAAARAKVKRYSKYSEQDSSGGFTKVFWVFEYRYKTPNFRHTEKVYFEDWKVIRAEHSVEPR